MNKFNNNTNENNDFSNFPYTYKKNNLTYIQNATDEKYFAAKLGAIYYPVPTLYSSDATFDDGRYIFTPSEIEQAREIDTTFLLMIVI